MSASSTLAHGVDTIDELRSRGFTGFHTVAMLREDAGAVPVASGVWAVVRDAEGVPHFQSRSTGAVLRGEDPSLPADVLAARWVPRSCLLYVEAAPGTGVRHLLQQRVKRFLRFGQGRNVAPAGGQAIWQLAGTGGLRVAWRETAPDEARAAAADLRTAFEERHGQPPFGNAGEEGER